MKTLLPRRVEEAFPGFDGMTRQVIGRGQPLSPFPLHREEIQRVRATGHEALITSPAALGDALEGRTGTRIHS